MKWSSQYDLSETNSVVLLPLVKSSYDSLLFWKRWDEDSRPVFYQLGPKFMEIVVSPFAREASLFVLTFNIVHKETANVASSSLRVLDNDVDACVLFFHELLDL